MAHRARGWKKEENNTVEKKGKRAQKEKENEGKVVK